MDQEKYSACDVWMLNHLDRNMSIYNIPEAVAVAYPLAMTSANIQAGFKHTAYFTLIRKFLWTWILLQVILQRLLSEENSNNSEQQSIRRSAANMMEISNPSGNICQPSTSASSQGFE